MSAAVRSRTLIETLPPIRGRATANAPLAPFTWFRVGGPAEVLVRPADAEDLMALLAALPPEVPLTTIGAASNLIIREGGIPGLVVRLGGRGFGAIAAEDGAVVAGAAALDVGIAEVALSAGLAGLEFLSGIPGSIGGAVAMNAGAYGSDLSEVLDWAEIVSRSGAMVRLSAADLAYAYRHSALPAGVVVVRARLRAQGGNPGGGNPGGGNPGGGNPAAIAARMAEIRASREATQPIRARTGGSTFQNPPDMKAWELIAGAGCRGLKRGQAEVSEKHCNFLINTGGATAADLEGLGEEIRARVLAASGVALEWEIRRLGLPAGNPRT